MVEESRRRKLEEALQLSSLSCPVSSEPLPAPSSSSSLIAFKWKEPDRAREKFWLELRARRKRLSVGEEQKDVETIRRNGTQTLQKIKGFCFQRSRGCHIEHLVQHLRARKRNEKQNLLKMEFPLVSSSWTSTGYMPEQAADAFVRMLRSHDTGYQKSVIQWLESTLSMPASLGQGFPAFSWIAVMEQLELLAVEDRRNELSALLDQMLSELQSASETWSPLTAEVDKLLRGMDELEGAYPLIHCKQFRVNAKDGNVSLRTNVTPPTSLAFAHPLFEDKEVQCKYDALRKYSSWVSQLQVAYRQMKDLLSEARSKWSSSPDLDGMLHRVQLSDVTACILGSCGQTPLDVTSEGEASAYTRDNRSGRKEKLSSDQSKPRARWGSWGLLGLLNKIKVDCACGEESTYSAMFEKMGLPQLHPSYLFTESVEKNPVEASDGEKHTICYETLVSKVACIPLQILAEIVESRLHTGIYGKKDLKFHSHEEEKRRLDELLKISKVEPILNNSKTSTNMFLDCTNLFAIARQYQRTLSEHMIRQSVDLQERIFPEEESVKDQQLNKRLMHLFEWGYVFCLQSSLETFGRSLESDDAEVVHSIVGGTRAVRDSLRRFHRDCVMWPRDAAKIIGSWKAELRAAIMQCQMASVLLKQSCFLLKKCSVELISTETTSTPLKSPVALSLASPCSDESADRHVLLKAKSMSEKSSGSVSLSDGAQESDLSPLLDFSSSLHGVLEVCSESVKRAAAAIADVFLSRQYSVRDPEALIPCLISSDYTLINFPYPSDGGQELVAAGSCVLFSPALVISVRYDDERFNVQHIHKLLTQSTGDNDAFDGHAIIFKCNRKAKGEQAGKTFEEMWEEKRGEIVSIDLREEGLEIPEHGILQTFDDGTQSQFRLLAGNYRQLQREIKAFEQTIAANKADQLVRLQTARGANLFGSPINTFAGPGPQGLTGQELLPRNRPLHHPDILPRGQGCERPAVPAVGEAVGSGGERCPAVCLLGSISIPGDKDLSQLHPPAVQLQQILALTAVQACWQSGRPESNHKSEVARANNADRAHCSRVNKQLKFGSRDEDIQPDVEPDANADGDDDEREGDGGEERDLSPRSAYLERTSHAVFPPSDAGDRRGAKLLGTVVNVEEEKKIISNPGEFPRSWIRGERIGYDKFIGFFQESKGEAENCVYKGHYCDTHEMIAVRKRKLKKG
eukprot:751112-Hanusia_phi.AAC.2